MIRSLNKDSIAAIATPPGKGALGIIRVSGEDCIQRVNTVFKGKSLEKVGSHSIHFGRIVNDEGEVLDEVLVSVFHAPRTYTGENLVEISCHGSMFILNEVMNLLLTKGIRHAEAGEFTLRAFMNEKMDLSQAEAVVDIIDSENKAAHQVAMSHMRGGFSDKIQELRDKLLNLTSLFELELDFAEEDVEFATNDELMAILDEVKTEVGALIESFKLGNVLKKGVSVVIAGRPNAGKSTLLNALLEEERAITSNIPGTTRDFIEDVINIDGIFFRFADTAGLTSKTRDAIEREGIERSISKIRQADLVIYLFDITELSVAEVQEDLGQLSIKSPYLVVANKIDKARNNGRETLRQRFRDAFDNIVVISSKYQQNISKLKVSLVETLDIEQYQGDQSIVTNTRHYSILSDIMHGISDVHQGIEGGLTKDFIAIDIRKIIQLMGEITGQITNDEILGNIFSRFCIGK